MADAMHQVLDFVRALENLEGDSRNIVWRLTDAHTNSPPFTLTVTATPINPSIAVSIEASRVAKLFSTSVTELINGRVPAWLYDDVVAPLRGILKRNLNGISQTEFSIPGEDKISVVPSNAQQALSALEIAHAQEKASAPNYTRTEYGSIEATVVGITRRYEKPALSVVERISGKNITCVLTDEMAAQLGPEHDWAEVWDGQRMVISGALHFDEASILKRVDVHNVEPSPWADVTLAEIRDLNILSGRSIKDHLDAVWGEFDG